EARRRHTHPLGDVPGTQSGGFAREHAQHPGLGRRQCRRSLPAPRVRAHQEGELLEAEGGLFTLVEGGGRAHGRTLGLLTITVKRSAPRRRSIASSAASDIIPDPPRGAATVGSTTARLGATPASTAPV